ncbi:MAG: L,D-transpeptidase/peptidoglycan binding protein, partial [Lachnoclostridium sp.]|nr:L,D-transpeptidase/peptidoglycan binding protein [Lachnoclostridium sp.]
MRKRVFQKIFLLLCIALLQIVIAYIGLAYYYRNAFEYGTWINRIYCTGKSIEEVNRELSEQYEGDGITIYDKENNAYQISAKEIGCQYDFESALKLYLDRQNAWLWIDSFWKVRDDTISPVVSYDETLLEECFSRLPFVQEEDGKDRKFEIIKTKDGYQLLNERTNVLDVTAARNAVAAALQNAQNSISLSEAGCYYDMELTNEMQEILHEWELIEDFQNCHIVYQMGEEQIPIDASVVCDWILLEDNGAPALDESGALQIREDAIPEFITALANEYDTVGAARTFQTTKRGVVTVEGGIYGNRLDKEAEIAYLTDAFARKADEVHTPAYLQTAMQQGKDDVGNTYIEIDMEQQMMYYYLNGVLQIETSVVTGNTSRRMGTPEGVNYVYAKQTNRILRGQGYASHVNFWMPVKGNIGIHDAAWRSNYG